MDVSDGMNALGGRVAVGDDWIMVSCDVIQEAVREFLDKELTAEDKAKFPDLATAQVVVHPPTSQFWSWHPVTIYPQGARCEKCGGPPRTCACRAGIEPIEWE